MKLLQKITKPILMPTWAQDLVIAIPRIVCGYLLCFDFGSAKFGLPWSPIDNNLGLFEVAFWFPKADHVRPPAAVKSTARWRI